MEEIGQLLKQKESSPRKHSEKAYPIFNPLELQDLQLAVKKRAKTARVGKHTLSLTYMVDTFNGTIEPGEEYVHFKPTKKFKFTPRGYYRIKKLNEELNLSD
jgi:hypothetical protein